MNGLSIPFDLNAIQPGDVVLIGVPWDENSSYLRGAAEAPVEIRRALNSPSTNLWTEGGLDLGEAHRLKDAGDLALSSGMAAREQIEAGIGELLERGARVMSLGGDHAVTYPILRAFARRFPRLNLLHLDAHPDLYEVFEGNRFSHACPFARIMEEGLAARLVQVGIRTASGHQRAQGQRFGVEMVEMRAWQPDMRLDFDGPLYLSLDLDVLDPAFAPGVSHYEPGGLSTREVLSLVERLPGPLVGADLVELNPGRDRDGVTAMVAAKLLKEILALMLDASDYRSIGVNLEGGKEL